MHFIHTCPQELGYHFWSMIIIESRKLMCVFVTVAASSLTASPSLAYSCRVTLASRVLGINEHREMHGRGRFFGFFSTSDSQQITGCLHMCALG